MDKNEFINLNIKKSDFSIILNALRRSNSKKEAIILMDAIKQYESRRDHKKMVLSLNKEIQIIKTKQKLNKGIRKLKEKKEKLSAINISKESGISLPTVYKYKDSLLN